MSSWHQQAVPLQVPTPDLEGATHERVMQLIALNEHFVNQVQALTTEKRMFMAIINRRILDSGAAASEGTAATLPSANSTAATLPADSYTSSSGA